MSRKTRWILFILSILIFAAASYGVVVYALGYEYDFSTRQFVRTGSFRVVANTNSPVFINDAQSGNTSFLGNSFSKGLLVPRSYRVALKKDSYHVWQKNVTVYAGFFIDFPKIVLLPNKLSEEIIPSSSSFHILALPRPLPAPSILSPDENKELLVTRGDVLLQWLNESGYQPYDKAGMTELIARFPQDIIGAWWYRDSNHVIIQTGSLIKFLEIDKRGGLNIFDIGSSSLPILYNRNENALYFWREGALIKASLE